VDAASPVSSASATETFDPDLLPEGDVTLEPEVAPEGNAKGPALAANGELDWNEIVAQLTLQGLVRELARNTALKAYDGKVIDLVLAPQHENLRAERLVSGLELALKEQFYSDVRIRLSFDGAQSLDTPSQRMTKAQLQRQQDAESSIDDDPTVKSLRDVFGATVEKVEPHGNMHG
jgi:DNA polymerase III subunit gamma/tau